MFKMKVFENNRNFNTKNHGMLARSAARLAPLRISFYRMLVFHGIILVKCSTLASVCYSTTFTYYRTYIYY